MSRARLRAAGAVVAELHDGSGLEARLSPRPHLTAATAEGVAVTDVGPDDHAHHLGASLALADVDGTTFWGGRTFVAGSGSTWLDNHGTQEVASLEGSETALRARIDWRDRAGRRLIVEDRELEATEIDGGWALAWRSSLAAFDADVSIGSPHTNGRDGAFYGGIFWRTPFAAADVATADGAGVEAAHGSRSPWITLQAPEATLAAATTGGMPWFVRTEGYVGFGPAVAVEGRRVIPAGGALALDLAVAIAGPGADPMRLALDAARALEAGVAA